MRRETANVLLVLLGGALLKIAWTGDYLRFVKPSLLPFLVATGVVILALAGVAIVRDVRRAAAASAEEHGRSPWLLLLPVLAVFLVAPPALGADAVTRAAQTVAAQDRSDAELGPLPPGDVVALPLGEFVTRAVWDASGSVDERRVRLTGFLVQGEQGEQPRLARLRIACCAADAVPVTVRLDGADVAGVPSDTWFEVVGEVVPGSATPTSGFVPALAVTSIRPVAPPAQQYEY